MAPAERSERTQALIDEFTGGSDINVYSTLARHPDVLDLGARLGDFLRSANVTPRHREILILRTACLCGSDYVYARHVALGRKAGLAEADLDRVIAGPDANGWDTFELRLIQAADELHVDASLSEETWEKLTERYDDQQMIVTIMLCGFYHMISFFVNSLGVSIEEGVENRLRASWPPPTPPGTS